MLSGQCFNLAGATGPLDDATPASCLDQRLVQEHATRGEARSVLLAANEAPEARVGQSDSQVSTRASVSPDCGGGLSRTFARLSVAACLGLSD